MQAASSCKTCLPGDSAGPNAEVCLACRCALSTLSCRVCADLGGEGGAAQAAKRKEWEDRQAARYRKEAPKGITAEDFANQVRLPAGGGITWLQSRHMLLISAASTAPCLTCNARTSHTLSC